MKKRILTIALVMTLLLSIAPFSASATTGSDHCMPNDGAETQDNKADNVMYCYKCNTMGELQDEWWEYSTYYARLWQQLKCMNPDCNFVWNTCIMEISYLNSTDEETQETLP